MIEVISRTEPNGSDSPFRHPSNPFTMNKSDGNQTRPEKG
ncbi:hypothetical protein RISK_002209 [Rhodopirellula islandica]|uniref:Uncharacterized protein n=1 Tax=Rhodopirellula islandica TaxID=595434 RepID=A0A0J1BGA4_RHOIS|nr:hypothetical protein RISK_002209 [Rhodopirellula islandica]